MQCYCLVLFPGSHSIVGFWDETNSHHQFETSDICLHLALQIAGALAENGCSLEEVTDAAQQVADSIGMGP